MFILGVEGERGCCRRGRICLVFSPDRKGRTLDEDGDHDTSV